MTKFNKDNLPILGVSWFYFQTLSEANEFATWATKVTARDENPCEAEINYDSHAINSSERYEVKVKNW